MPTHDSEFTRFFSDSDRLILPASAELRALVAMLRAQPRPPDKTLETIDLARRNFDKFVAAGLRANGLDPEQPTAGVRVHDVVADGVPLVVAEPVGAVRGAVLHIHGGGWCIGSARSLTSALARWASELSAVVASVEYRLAPEHIHPAAIDDCERAALWWTEHVRANHGIRRSLIAGESAGAHLALLTTLRLRRRHDIRLDGACFTYGLYDFANGLPSRTIADDGALMIDSRRLEFYRKAYLGDPARALDAEVSPLRADLAAFTDLPPALFATGTLDPLADDSVLMCDRWRRAGNRAWLATYEGAPHAFDLFAVPEAAHLETLRLAFMREHLAAD